MLEIEGPALRMIEGCHGGSIIKVAFSPHSSHFTVVWQEFEEEPELTFSVFSRACERLASFVDEEAITEPSLAYISGNRLAIAHLGEFHIRCMSSCGSCSPPQGLSPSWMACPDVEARLLPIEQVPSWHSVQPSV